ncbi:MAG TPA: carboxypeptidase regulatory-like domain-containing protein, partial [Enhygromyxa sp.]|nr:carboxypeptidase regulatory-like domain-containing protein [Enhygromyxa sp.]
RRAADDGSAQASEQAGPSSPSGAGAGASKAASKLDLAGAPKASISGSVRDPEGRPIEGAQVCAFSDDNARRGLDDRQLHCARSGPDGYYRIDGLLPVLTEVHASAATYKPTQWERRERGTRRTELPLRAGQTAEGIDVILEPGGVLVIGVVRDIAGGEIEGAHVMTSGDWFTRSEARAVTTSGDEGRFELWTAPGTIVVNAQAEGYAQGSVEAIAPGEFIELFLTPESVLIGKVVLASSGEPVEDVTVSVGRASTRTDASGRFRIDRLQPGMYKPYAEGDELYGHAAEQVHLGLGETSEEVVIRVHPAVHVEGKVVVAGSERPCTQGWVRLDNPGKHSEHAELDDEGHVEFRGVLAGEYEVTVGCEAHVAEDHYDKLVVGEENLGGLVWQVREGLAIRGEVVDEAGQPLADIEVNARAVADPEAARSQLTYDSQYSERDGSFELSGLLPGRYELGTSSWRSRPGPLEPITVELQSGADVNDVRIVMPALGSIRGRVLDEANNPVAGAYVNASEVGGLGQQSTRSNDAGEFTLEHVRPGQARVTALSSDSWWPLRKPGTSDDDIQGELVEVTADEVAELTLIVESRDGRITGVVKDEGGGVVADAFIDVERMSEKAGANASAARRGVRWSWGSEPVLTDADGRFALDGLPDGEFVVRAHRKGGGEAVLEKVALGSHIELVIASTGELAGTVKLADGSAPERFNVTIEDKAAGIVRRDSFFRTDGAWRLQEVPAGSFEIIASATEGSVTLEPALTLAEGEVRGDIELVLESRLTVRGRLVDLETGEPIAGIEVHASGRNTLWRPGSANEHRNVSGPDGRFELDNIPAGRVELMAWNRAGGSKSKYEFNNFPLTLAAEPLVQDVGDLKLAAKRLEPNQEPGDLGYELNAWDPTIERTEWEPVVALVRPAGPADGSGLAAGDVIEKVDGHGVSGSNSGLYRTLTSVPPGTKITLEIRGGKKAEIVAGPPIN